LPEAFLAHSFFPRKGNHAMNSIPDEYPRHFIFRRQRVTGFSDRVQTGLACGSAFHPIRIWREDGIFHLEYDGSLHDGAPCRRGYDPVTRNFAFLREPAMSLTAGEYGRILYNNRCTGLDTGEWWYEFHIMNAICTTSFPITLDLFVRREPDKVYRQIARLK
jgi:hypothetical protein